MACAAGDFVGARGISRAENGEGRCEAPLPIFRAASPLVNFPLANNTASYAG